MIECKLCKINNDDVQRLLAKNAIKLSIYLHIYLTVYALSQSSKAKNKSTIYFV